MKPVWCMLKKEMFSKTKHLVFWGPSEVFTREYSHDLMPKNRSPIMRSPMAWEKWQVLRPCIFLHTARGRHQAWCLVARSEFLYPLIWHFRR